MKYLLWPIAAMALGAGVLSHQLDSTVRLAVGAPVSKGKAFRVLTPWLGRFLPTIHGPTDRSHREPEYSRAASAFAGAPRSVFCWSEEDWESLQVPAAPQGAPNRLAGFAMAGHVHLSPSVCHGLELIHYRSPRPRAALGTAVALLAFTHEVLHTMGVRNEAMADCYGIQLAGRMSRLLGATAAFGNRLRQLLVGWYKPSSVAPGYWSGECRDGGTLDLNPNVSRWP